MKSEYKEKVRRRLRIIRGQVEGVAKQVEEERYCLEILTQIAAIQEALRGAAAEVVRNHLETCVTDAIKKGRGRAHYKELTDIMFKLNR